MPRRSKYRIIIPHPERRNMDIILYLPSPKRCFGSPRSRRPVYCGNRRSIPRGYRRRRASPYECLRKGFGAGMCSVYKP